MIKSITLLLTITCLLSCRTIKPLPSNKEAKTIIRHTTRDTVVNVPGERASFRALVGVDAQGKPAIQKVLHTQSNKRAKVPQVSLKDSFLNVDCLCDSMSIYLKLKNTHITDMLRETVYIPTEKALSMWQQIQLWLGRVLLIGMAGGAAITLLYKRI